MGQLLTVHEVRPRMAQGMLSSGETGASVQSSLREDAADFEGGPDRSSLSTAVGSYVLYYEEIVTGNWRGDSIVTSRE